MKTNRKDLKYIISLGVITLIVSSFFFIQKSQNDKIITNNKIKSVLIIEELNKNDVKTTEGNIQISLEKAVENEATAENNIKAPTSTVSNEQDNEPKEIFFGQWVIKKQVAYGPVGTFNSDDIKGMIGKNLSFSREKASCFGDQVSNLSDIAKNPVYKESIISKSDFETDNRITFDKLGIKSDSITQVIINDSKGNGCLFFIKDINTLILFGGGVYLELDRV